MKELPERLRKNGFEYTLVKRNKNYCIYMQHFVRYEVFKRRFRNSRKVVNVELPGKEVFPHNEAFGNNAWSCWSLESANRKYNKFNEKHQKGKKGS